MTIGAPDVSHARPTRATSHLRQVVVLYCFLWLFLIAALAYPLLDIAKRACIIDGRFSLAAITLLFQDPYLLQSLSNSLQLAVTVTAITTIISLPIAILLTRCSFRGRSLVLLLLNAPLLLPPFIGVLGLRQLLGRFGSFNLFLLRVGIVTHPPDWLQTGNASSVGALQVLHLYPILVGQLMSALRAQPKSLTESARSVGASSWQIIRSITIPLCLPSLVSGASLVFISSFTDLGTPLLFEYRTTIPVVIFNMLTDRNENAVGYALIIAVGLLSGLFFWLGGRGLNREKVGRSVRIGAGEQLQPITGWYRLVFVPSVLAITLLSVVPHLGIILLALSRGWFFTILPTTWTTQNLVTIFRHPLTLRGLTNSILLAITSTTVTTVLGLAIAWVTARSTIRSRAALKNFSLLPLAIPGIIIAFGYLGAFTGTPLDSAGNPLPLLALAYTIRRLPMMVSSCLAGFEQVSGAFEEAARSVGASPGRILRSITAPLLREFILAGAVLCFSFAMVEVSDSIILAREERYYPIAKALYALTARPDGIEIASALGVVVMVVSATLLWAATRIQHSRKERA